MPCLNCLPRYFFSLFFLVFPSPPPPPTATTTTTLVSKKPKSHLCTREEKKKMVAEKEEVAAAEGVQEEEEEEPEVGSTTTVAASVEEEDEVVFDVGAVEEILGYRFLNTSLVVEALTHGSYYFPAKPGGVSYERLEFVGDAVLNCLMARDLFTKYKDFAPGPLTRLRAANVDTERLARVAVVNGLHHYLRHKGPLLMTQIQDFTDATLQYPIHSNGLVDPPKVLADIVESLLGAVFMDSNSNLETVWEVFLRLAEPLINPETLGRHPVSELYELCQKNRMRVAFMDTWAENTKVDVLINGNLVGSAAYGHKKEIAHNRAAKAALDNLKMAFAKLESSSSVVNNSD